MTGVLQRRDVDRVGRRADALLDQHQCATRIPRGRDVGSDLQANREVARVQLEILVQVLLRLVLLAQASRNHARCQDRVLVHRVDCDCLLERRQRDVVLAGVHVRARQVVEVRRRVRVGLDDLAALLDGSVPRLALQLVVAEHRETELAEILLEGARDLRGCLLRLRRGERRDLVLVARLRND